MLETTLQRVLRGVFGGGIDISAANPLQVYDPVVTSVGKLQLVATTIELNQAAGNYDLFTGITQDVVVEKLMIRIPEDVSGGAMTSLSIQTDDTTAQVFIDAAAGAQVNLTAQAQLSWTGTALIKVGSKIQLIIAGAATGIACSCDVIAECRAVVAEGTLA